MFQSRDRIYVDIDDALIPLQEVGELKVAEFVWRLKTTGMFKSNELWGQMVKSFRRRFEQPGYCRVLGFFPQLPGYESKETIAADLNDALDEWQDRLSAYKRSRRTFCGKVQNI